MSRHLAALVFVVASCCLVTTSPTWAADDADELLPGKLLLVRPASLFKFIARPLGAFELPSAGNEPTVAGATLHVFDTGSVAGDDMYVLPTQGSPLGWRGLGSPSGSKGFKYKGAGTTGDPCKVVLLKPTILKAVCKGPGVALAPPAGGSLAIVLTTTGAGSKRYCAAFGGSDVENSPSLLKRTNATAIPCVEGSTATSSTSSSSTSTSSTTTTTVFAVCGNGIIEGTEHCDDANTMPNDGCDAICQIEETTNGMGGPSGPVTTSDSEADGATPADPLETTVANVSSESVVIFESSPGTPPPGYEFRGQAAFVTASNASSASVPLDLTFEIDASQIRPGETEATVQVFRNGILVAPCLGLSGTAVPEPCVAERTLLPGGNVRLRVFATHTSPWAFGYPLCGNGMLDGAETCDPPAGGCGAGDSCKSDCTCAPACDCCAGSPTRLIVTHSTAASSCGTVQNSMGVTSINLNCATVYFGGGGNSTPPFAIPDGQFVLKVTSCDPANERLTLGPTTAPETGNVATCTSAGCRFGGPIAIPNPGSTPTSACLLPTISQSVSGLASCGGVVSQLALPVVAEIFLTGDTATDPMNTISGIQPCPLCSAGFCVGGPNNGMACIPGDSAFNAGYPTSNDCPPSPALSIGTIAVGPVLTTGTVKWTGTVATNDTGHTASTQNRVFVGYCRDADGTGAFQFPAHQCWENGVAVGTACGGAFESCEQRNNGAFGPSGGPNMTINQLGSAPGCLADELPHATKIVGPMRVPMIFDATTDAANDLPGPGAVAFDGSMQLQ